MERIKILDCTLRDGGYYNSWNFGSSLVHHYLESVAAAGIDYVELGFRFAPKREFLGPFAYTTERHLGSLQLPVGPKYGVMVNASDLAKDDTLIDQFPDRRAGSPISLVRVASHLHELQAANQFLNEVKERGYETGLNIMQVSKHSSKALVQALSSIGNGDHLDVLYFADSLGNMGTHDIDRVFSVFHSTWSGPIGIHTHDNSGRALENALHAADIGASWLDCTIQGMGRGAGNAATESLLVRMAERLEGRYDIRPIIAAAQDQFLALKHRYGWGTNSLYQLGALRGIHPTYLQHMLSEDRYEVEDIVSFIEQVDSEDASSFNPEILNSTDLAPGTRIPGSWSAENWLESDTAILIAGGPAGQDHVAALSMLSERAHTPMLSLNLLDHIPDEIVTAVVTCHPARIHALARKICHGKTKLLAPIALLKRSKALDLRDEQVLDYGVAVEPDTYDANSTGCTVPIGLTLPYALSALYVGGARRILLYGFDGYEASDPRHHESNYVFNAFGDAFPNVELIAITPTNYNVQQGSIYAELRQ